MNKIYQLYISIYKKIFGPYKTCLKFGHDFVYPATCGLPPSKCYCKCCHRRFNISYCVDFLRRGASFKEVDKWNEKTENDIKNWQ